MRAQWEAEGRAKQDGLNTVLHDGSRFTRTTPTDSQVSNGELSGGIPWTAASGAPDVDPASLTAARCLNIWEGPLQNPPGRLPALTSAR